MSRGHRTNRSRSDTNANEALEEVAARERVIFLPLAEYPPPSWSKIFRCKEAAGKASKHKPWLEEASSQAFDMGSVLKNVEMHESGKAAFKDRIESIPEDEAVNHNSRERLFVLERACDDGRLSKLCQHGALLYSDDILPTFRKRMRQIYRRYDNYLYANRSGDPVIAQLAELDKEVDAAKLECIERVETDRYELDIFLARCLHVEYQVDPSRDCSDDFPIFRLLGCYLDLKSRDSPESSRELARLARRESLTMNDFDERLGRHLDMVIRFAGYDEAYVKRRIQDYWLGSTFTDRVQCLIHEKCWLELGQKLQFDLELLDIVLPTREGVEMPEKWSIHCKIATLRNMYFMQWNGPEHFTLSKVARKLGEQKQRAASEPSVIKSSWRRVFRSHSS